MKGYIYIFSNRAYKCVKIGKARMPRLRVKQLSGETGVLYPFRIEAYFRSEDYTADEQLAHRTLHQYRRFPNKEFFNISPADAIFALTKLFGAPKYLRPKYKTDLNTRQTQETQEKLQRQTKLKALQQQRQYQLDTLKAKRKRQGKLNKIMAVCISMAVGAILWVLLI